MGFTAIIVDDEPLARRSIRKCLKAFPEFTVVAECGDGQSAIAAVREHRPDLLFLDIQLPESDGFQVLAAIGKEAVPVTIFVTAYDRYALQAFEAHALDFCSSRFLRTAFATRSSMQSDRSIPARTAPRISSWNGCSSNWQRRRPLSRGSRCRRKDASSS